MQLCGANAEFSPSVLAAVMQQHVVDLQQGWPLQGDVVAAECFMQLVFQLHHQLPEQQEAPAWQDLLQVYPQAAAAAGNTVSEEVQQAQAVSIPFSGCSFVRLLAGPQHKQSAKHEGTIAANEKDRQSGIANSSALMSKPQLQDSSLEWVVCCPQYTLY